MRYEVGGKWPGRVPSFEQCTAQLVGSSFDLLAFVDGPTAKETKTFRDAFMRFHISVIDSIPLIAVSYLGSRWTWDASLNVIGISEQDAEKFFQPGNAVNLFLVDRPKGMIRAIRTVGISEEAERTIKDALRGQMTRYRSRAEFDAALGRIYAQHTTDDLIQMADLVCEFKGR
jgi:hypothetical protein